MRRPFQIDNFADNSPMLALQTMPLRFLVPGQLATVDEVLGEPADVHRLAELGVKPGAAIELVQPGNPCIIRLGGSKLCFRDSDLLSVLVRLEAA